MIDRLKALLFCAAALFVAGPAAAQVIGHDPAKSPYQDVEYNQELTFLGGWDRMRHDPAGAAPLSRPIYGIRYEWTLVGPLAFSSEFDGAFGHRNLLEPLKPKATRDIGTQNNGVYDVDMALVMNLPGTKSWHHLVPQVRGGIALMDSRARDDSSGFAFGTPFAFVYGAGVKLVPGGRIGLRADITDRVFHLSYPDSYYRPASDLTSVVDATTPHEFWTHHTAFTIGLSYYFAR